MPSLKPLGFGPVAGADSGCASALARGAELAPYLMRTLRRREEVLDELRARSPDDIFRAKLNAMSDAASLADAGQAMGAMRRAKEAAHAVIAAADLAGEWDLDGVVQRLTELADVSIQTGLRLAIRDGWANGRFGEAAEQEDLPGFFALAMGKMGAHELNYSSDVDLILLFDLDTCPASGPRLKQNMMKIATDLVRFLEERTEDGYVFRTDLRLRPDPGSTAPVVTTQFAHTYYESVGQNWERMAHIKARVCAGDENVGADYLQELEPFVWRRHLDYWAIADIHSIKRQIHSHGGHESLEAKAFDVKLGRGGIREIEFFAQVQQLILGGRRPELRISGTKAALGGLVEAGVVEPDVCADLCRAYDFLRGLEHRIQMLNDEQTHKLSDNPERRAQVAALYGYGDLEAFEADVRAVRRFVHDVYSDLFAEEERLSGAAGNLVFTGVDEDPGTVETLEEMGFTEPSKVIQTFQKWHRGGVAATRSARGQQLLTSLGPRLLQCMSDVGEPDTAFARFADFFGALPSGVQTMSLLLQEPAIATELIETMAFAPQLARDLARRPALLDAMMERRFQSPVSQDKPGGRQRELEKLLSRSDDFEELLNIARRYHREEAFRIGYQLLRRQIGSLDAGRAYADLADACVVGLAKVAEREVLGRYEGTIGKWVVCALGKFGGRELSPTSDLDLMLVYEAEEGGGQLAARFVQRLVAALSAPTEEGALYEVDMQLRPSGKAGPVAVKFSSFEQYYEGDAWTWEFMALTRLRPVAGDPDLISRIRGVRGRAIAAKAADDGVTADVVDMRERLLRERPASSHWDLKLWNGGLIDIEFIVQHELLKAGDLLSSGETQATRAAIDALLEAGRLTEQEGRTLGNALDLYLDLQQALRIAAGDGFSPDDASPGLKAWLARVMKLPDFAAVDAALVEAQTEVAGIRAARLGL